MNIARRVSLDLGVRYEIYSPLEPRNAGGAGFFNSLNNTFNYAGVGDIASHPYLYDLDNVAPRLLESGNIFHLCAHALLSRRFEFGQAGLYPVTNLLHGRRHFGSLSAERSVIDLRLRINGP